MQATGTNQASDKEPAGSLYGQDMLNFVPEFGKYTGCAYDTALYVLTHGGRYPVEHAVRSLGVFDCAAFEALDRHRELAMQPGVGEGPRPALVMFVNSLGRLHIRRSVDERPVYDPADKIVDIGYIDAGASVLKEIADSVAKVQETEAAEFSRLERSVRALHADGTLPDVLEQVIDHIEHVESVCFYVGDRFLALIDRYVNLVESRKGTQGFLTQLRGKDYSEWTKDDILVVAALHALFISGRSVRFEEFNGIALTATALWEKLNHLLRIYAEVGCKCDLPDRAGLFELAQAVREQTFKAEGKEWLRYRWIYGLNFQKSEQVLKSTQSSEGASVHLVEFADDFEEFTGRSPPPGLSESELFLDLARACVQRDAAGVACDRGSSAVRGWTEYLIERIVASAVLATSADYGMSSSFRDISMLVQEDMAALMKVVHSVKPASFFTCFVSSGFDALEKSVADTIAHSVQMRMMFNRWHFFPGNFERVSIAKSRHWYYPPLIPDIAIHSDVHRAAHNRARVKFSVRAPGPDMSRPALVIAGNRYRGFYDVRVVRMAGREFTTEDMLRTRRRTLWMERVYDALADHLHAAPGNRLPVQGFQPGEYLDIAPASRAPLDAGMGERVVA